MKHLWRGSFNYRQTVKILYTYACTEKQAWFILCKRLAKKDSVDPHVVMGLFDGSRDNFDITIETEFREIENDQSA